MISQVWKDSRHCRKLLKKQMPKDMKTAMVLLHPAIYQTWVKFCSIKEETLDNWYFWGHANIQHFSPIHGPTEVKIITFSGHFLSSTQPLIFQLPGSKIKLCFYSYKFWAYSTKFSVLSVNTMNSNSRGTSYCLHSLNSNLQPNSCSVQTQKCKMVPCTRIMYLTQLARSNKH